MFQKSTNIFKKKKKKYIIHIFIESLELIHIIKNDFACLITTNYIPNTIKNQVIKEKKKSKQHNDSIIKH